MKKRYAVMMILGLGLLIGGCREVTTTTRILPDGSCERIFEAKGDSSELADPGLALPEDPSWSITRKLGDDIEFTAKKRFESVTHMEEDLEMMGRDSLRLRYRFRLKKRFRWFSTVYKYSETVLPINPFHRIPITDYMSEEEILLYSMDIDTLDLEEKVDEWGEEAVYEEFYERLLQQVTEHPSLDVDPEILGAKKEALRTELEWSEIDEEDDEGVLEACRNVLGAQTVAQLEEEIVEILDEIHLKANFIMGIVFTDFSFGVIMPGLILGTNAPTVEGNRVIWDSEGTPFLFRPYKMWVESRKLNPWALWVAGGVVLLIIGVMAVMLVRRTKRS